jgi:aryl-alcohol dehydrogenase-like predicted oxidoreductase
MIRRRFGKAGFDVPVIGMGTYRVLDVRGAEEADRHRVVLAAQESGANLFDSSPMYGEAERVLGDAVRPFREAAIIATKVWTGHSTLTAEEQIEHALEYYGGKIDIYQIHNLHNWEENLRRLEQLKDAGMVRAVGITHYVESAFSLMKEILSTGRIDCIQIPYNVARTRDQQEMLDLATELDLGVIIMVPLGAGSLVKMEVPVEQLAKFKEYGCETWAQVLLKYVISDERVHTAIPATSSVERMRQNAAAGEGPLLPQELRQEAEAIYKRYFK